MPTPAATALDKTDEHSTTALYRAAIGEVNSAYYLPLFERFEAADRAGLSWNGPAALYTLNWLAFRQLWHAALLYAGTVVALALGIFGIGRLVFGLSETTQWALLGALVLLSLLLPGLGGNALLHRATRKRMEAALQATQTVPEACAMLSRKAPTRKGLIIQMVCNALAIGLLAYGWLQFEGWSATPAAALQATPDARNVAVGRAVDSSTPAAPAASAPVAASSAPQAAASAQSATSAVSAASAPAATPAASAPAGVASAPVGATSSPVARAASAAAVTTKPAAAAASAPVAARPAPATSRTAPAPVAAPKSNPAAAPAKIILLSKPVVVESATGAPPATAVPVPAASTDDKAIRYQVNVGMFSQENNARNALAQLSDAELPASRQTVRTAQGQRIRVRVGPFDTLAEAERAADKVRSLGLDAQVAPQ